MKVAVLGLWHLGCVTAACLAKAGHQVVGWDPDHSVVTTLTTEQRAPVWEPGLNELIGSGQADGNLRFTTDVAEAMADAAVAWITFDTPVDEDDRADVDFVLHNARRVLSLLPDGAVMLVSSQLPVGSVRLLEAEFAAAYPNRHAGFASAPENLRLGDAIGVFTKPDRVIIGVRHLRDRAVLDALFAPITSSIIWMGVESAEMTKHAINAFLATSVSFANEIAMICERVGADAGEVAEGLKTDSRIGPRAYLSAGGAFAGGTLARDVAFLTDTGERLRTNTLLLRSVIESNARHREWARHALEFALGSIEGRRIAVWGLTYKPGTDTLRRSSSVALCSEVAAAGAHVKAFDPAVRSLPRELASSIELAATPQDALRGADALVVATPWPVLREVHATEVHDLMAQPVVVDAGSFLRQSVGADPRIRYFSVGRRHR